MIFIDSGAWIARYYQPDALHRASILIWKTIENRALFTSNHVIDETLTLLGRRAGYAFAAERAEVIYSSKALMILRSTAAEELEAIRLFRKFADQRLSFTDCISFALMRRHRIKVAFSFDEHFRAAGFDLLGATRS